MNDGVSALNIADSAVGQLETITMRLKELAEHSATGTVSGKQRNALDQEGQALVLEYSRIVKTTSFNGLNIFDGTLSDGLSLQAGYGTSGVLNTDLGGKTRTGTVTAGACVVPQDINDDGYVDAQSADINGDGIPDFIGVINVQGVNGGYLETRLGDGKGGYTSTTKQEVSGYGGFRLAIGDVDGDGINDALVSGLDYNGAPVYEAALLKGSANGTFTLTSTVLVTGPITLADVNGDGRADLVTSDASGVSVRASSGNNFGVAQYVLGAGTGLQGVVDTNGDGILDIVANTGGNIFIANGKGGGSFAAAVTYATFSSAVQQVSFADLNNDGIKDLVADSSNASEGYSIRLRNSAGTFGSGTFFSDGNNATVNFSLGDLNGDGTVDIIKATGAATIEVALGSGKGSFGSFSILGSGNNNDLHGVLLSDLNQDGVLDITGFGDDTDYGARVIQTFTSNTRSGVASLLSFSLTSVVSSKQALTASDQNLTRFTQQRGVIGAFSSRIEVASGTLLAPRDSYSTAKSRITDVDVASESSELTRSQIVQRTAVSVLAQANLQPQIALKLLS